MKYKSSIFWGLAVLALLFVLLRENEAKVSAQNQLKNIQFKTTTVINEKGNAINELETQLTELQVKQQEDGENYEKMLAAKSQEMDQMAADAEAKAQQYEEDIRQKAKVIEDTETASKENSERYEKSLQKKSADMSEMGEELRKTTERLAAALKKQEKDEAENFELSRKITELEKEIRALKDAQKEAAAALAAPSSTADGPLPTDEKTSPAAAEPTSVTD